MAGRLILGQKSLTSYLQINVRQVLVRKKTADLLGRVLDEADTCFDVGLETFDGFLEELLLILVGAAEDVDGFLSSVGLVESVSTYGSARRITGHLRRAQRGQRSSRSQSP